MAACNSALRAGSGKTRRYINVVCCSLKIPPLELIPSSMWRCSRGECRWLHSAFTLSWRSSIFGAKDIHMHTHTSVWPLSGWRYGLAPFRLGIWTGPFLVGDWLHGVRRCEYCLDTTVVQRKG